MKPMNLYLDEAIDKGIAKNDSDIARKIGATRSAVSSWRTGRRAPDDDEAVQLAILLGKEPGELLAECGAARAKSQTTRAAWEKVAARMAGATLGLCLLFSHPGDANAEIPNYFKDLLFSELALFIVINGLLSRMCHMTECITVLRYVFCILCRLPDQRFYSAMRDRSAQARALREVWQHGGAGPAVFPVIKHSYTSV